jgi:hypothetical protein
MKLSVGNRLPHLLGRGPARRPARPPRTTRLQVEALEGRDVPTVMNLRFGGD